MNEILDTIFTFIQTESELITVVLTFLFAHFGASAYVASTTTKAGKIYKILEALALVVGKAKQPVKKEGEL